MRLRTSLAAAFAGLALAFTLVAAIAVQHVTAERLRGRIGGEVAELAGHISSSLDAAMSERWSDMQVMAAIAATADPAADRRPWLETLRRAYPAYAWIGFVDAKGLVTASTGRLLEGKSVAQRPWFQAALKGTFVGDVHEALLLAQLLPPLPRGEPWRFLDVAAPVRNAAGQVLGVVGGHLSWTWAVDAAQVASAPARARDARIEVLVVDAQGQVLLGPGELTGSRLPVAAPPADGTGRTGFALQDWPDGGRYLVGASRSAGVGDFPGLGWTVLVRQPAEAAFAPARRLSLEVAVGGVVLAALFALLGWVVAGRIAAPVLALAEAAETATAADAPDLRLPALTGCAEVRTLGGALTALSARLAERDRALAAANAALEGQVAERTRELRLARDLAELAQARAENASRAKTEFVATMSHEIRTPLNAIMGFSELLAADPGLGPLQRRYAEAATTSSATLRAIIDDVLDFARIEAGELSLHPQPFDLAPMVRGVAAVVATTAEEKGLALEVSVDPAADRWWHGDDNRLRQILVNLLGNAVKFTQRGRVSLQVACLEAGDGSATLRFAVTDTGIGIAQESLGRLFTTFTQADGSIGRRFGGTGLGLAIVKRLVELMGGRVGLESRVGAGSTFWFTVALARAADAARAPGAPDAAASNARSRPARLLLVDDMQINRELAQAVLERAGYAVAAVPGGAEAVAAVRSGGFDLVLMDIQMPGMDGLAATRAIRALQHPSRRIPVVAMSANVLPDQIQAYRQAGMNGHIGKPFVWSELYAVLEAHLPDVIERAGELDLTFARATA